MLNIRTYLLKFAVSIKTQIVIEFSHITYLIKTDFFIVAAKFEIQFNIPDVKILNIEMSKTNDLVITVKSTNKSSVCRKCGQNITKIHDYGEAILLRHLPVFGQSVYIRSKPARFECEKRENKPTTTEEPNWYN